jgi:hypothetical protein
MRAKYYLGLWFITIQILAVNSLFGSLPENWRSFDERQIQHDNDNTKKGDPPGTELRLSVFDVDVTPPVGYEMAFGTVINKWDLGLRAKGLVISGAGMPVVLCAFDWHSIANESQDAFRNAFAEAAGTIPERVVVHTLHQHDAPICDFGAEKMLKEAGIDPEIFNGNFAREAMDKVSAAIKKSLDNMQTVTHIGIGEAPVYEVASNRRILGEDGRVRAGRSSSARIAELRAEPEGVIDPMVSLISFWSKDKALAVMSFYATHPQSYYRTGIPNPDFPGIARFFRQLQVPEAMHIHFAGAAGNVAAGKYNDGSRENRGKLAHKLADGMKRAWDSTERFSLSPEKVSWESESVALPPADHLIKLEKDAEADKKLLSENRNAQKLAWYNRCRQGRKTDVQCLKLGEARILFMPGELFVEYQLAAKRMRPDLFVAMAAYGDFGPHYIGTEIAYSQGGYEVSASDVSSEVEKILMSVISKLLEADN